MVSLAAMFDLDLVELFNSHSVYPFSLYCRPTMLWFVTPDFIKRRYMHTYRLMKTFVNTQVTKH